MLQRRLCRDVLSRKMIEAKDPITIEEIKRAVDIPARWGAKISGAQFQKRAAVAIKS